MHELSIAESILAAVRTELLRHPGARPIRIGLRIGEMAAIDVDSLTFCFEAILAGTEWESLTLDAKICPAKRLCGDCGGEFNVVDYNAICPACGSASTSATGGDELDFDYLEIENYDLDNLKNLDNLDNRTIKAEGVDANGTTSA